MALIQVSEVGFPKVIGKVWSEKNICLQSAWLEKSPELGVRAQRSGPGFAIHSCATPGRCLSLSAPGPTSPNHQEVA